MQIHCCMLALQTGRPVKMMYYARNLSMATYTAIRPACATSTGRPVPGNSFTSRRASSSMVVPTRRLQPRSVGTRPPSPVGHMRFPTSRSTASPFTRTTRLAVRSAVSARCRLVSHMSPKWTSSPTRSEWIRSSSDQERHVHGIDNADGPDRRRARASGGALEPREGDAGPVSRRHRDPDLRTLPGGVSIRLTARGSSGAPATRSESRTSPSPRVSTTMPPPTCVCSLPEVMLKSKSQRHGRGRSGVGIVQIQIARTELGVESVTLLPADTAIGSAGSSWLRARHG